MVNSGMAPSKITTHIEDSGLEDTVRSKLQGTRMWMHGYVTVATELARRSDWEFRHCQGDANLDKALIVAAIVLITWVRSWRADAGMANNQYLSRSMARMV